MGMMFSGQRGAIEKLTPFVRSSRSAVATSVKDSIYGPYSKLPCRLNFKDVLHGVERRTGGSQRAVGYSCRRGGPPSANSKSPPHRRQRAATVTAARILVQPHVQSLSLEVPTSLARVRRRSDP